MRARLRSLWPAHASRLPELWRYYQAGVVNSAFGFGCYSVLVFLGLNTYVAQLCAHVMGVIFNYFSYSRHAFRNHRARLDRFMGAYIVNYLIGLAFLTLFLHLTTSPYIAGFLSLVASSIVNYFILKRFVFTRRKVGS